MFNRLNVARASLSVVAATMLCSPAFAWEPSKAVEMVLPSGSGSGTDQMARLMSSIVVKHNLAKKPYIVTPKGVLVVPRVSSTSKLHRLIRTRS